MSRLPTVDSPRSASLRIVIKEHIEALPFYLSPFASTLARKARVYKACRCKNFAARWSALQTKALARGSGFP